MKVHSWLKKKKSTILESDINTGRDYACLGTGGDMGNLCAYLSILL